MIEYAGRKIPCESVTVEYRKQEAPPIRQGYGGRSDRQGVRQYLIQSLHGGLGVLTGAEIIDGLRYRSSQGLIAHLVGRLMLPYELTTQASLTATDISGFRAANLRVHSVNSTLGQSKRRFYAGVGKKLYRNNSDTNEALADSTLSLTDNITGMFEGKMNNVSYLILTTDGTTNDISGTTNPTATPPTLATLLALSAGDWTGGGVSLAGLNANVYYGKIGGVGPGLFFTLHSAALASTPQIVVDKTTAHVANSANATITTATKAATAGFSDLTAGTITFANTDRITAEDASSARASSSAAATTNYLAGVGFGHNIPSGSVVTGNTFTIKAREAAGSDEVYWDGTNGSGVFLVLNNAVKTNISRTATAELAVTLTNYTWGSSTDPFAGLEASEVNDPGFGCAARFDIRDVGSADVDVDFMSNALTYRPPGTHLLLPSGGYIVGEDPNNANTIYIVAPLADENATVNVPRQLYKVVLSFDTDGERVVGTLTKVGVGLSHVESVCFALGGIVVAGDTISGVAKAVKHIRPDGSIVDLAFNSIGQGFTEAWGIINMWGAGRVLVADAALESGLVVQTWIYYDNTWHPISPRETTTVLPIAYAEDAQICTELRQRYRIIPNTTNTDVTRSFHPRSFFLDPLNNDTSEVKANGVLTTTLPDLDLLGPEESNKMLLTARCLSRDVSSTNTIRLRYSTDGGSTFTTWATFTTYASKSTLASPVNFRKVMLEIGLDHTAGTSGTPNGLPIVIEGAAVWPRQRQWTVRLNPTSAEFLAEYPGGIDDLWDTLAALDPVNTLKPGSSSASVPAEWRDYQVTYIPAGQPTARELQVSPKGNIILFTEVAS